MTNGPELPLAREFATMLERALNREIAESTPARDLVADLEGESFAIDMRGPGIAFVLSATGGRVAVELRRQAVARPISATLSATPIDLLRLARAADLSTLRGTGAEISGSPEIAERFAMLLKLARPDLEEHAARWLGDVPAHALGDAARAAGAWLARVARALRADTAEFLQEESRALPAALEAQAFYVDVERLRDDVERAAARLARLERR